MADVWESQPLGAVGGVVEGRGIDAQGLAIGELKPGQFDFDAMASSELGCSPKADPEVMRVFKALDLLQFSGPIFVRKTKGFIWPG